MNSCRALIVGFGSIGARHYRLLTELGCNVAVVTARDVTDVTRYSDLASALVDHKPDYVVIANDTARHYSSVTALKQHGYSGRVLVEKPLFECSREFSSHGFAGMHVAYNLRFNPVLGRLRAELSGQSLLSISCYVGQYLPFWRPGTDYRQCYSADAERGGGVLLDLSHDLDYVCWLAGDWTSVVALGGTFSRLEITSDDHFGLLFPTKACPLVSVQLNYLDRLGRRRLVVNTDEHTYEADLINNTLKIDREELTFEVDRDTTYRAMHQAMLSDCPHVGCSLPEAASTLALIDAARISVKDKNWVAK